jgi:hypothetical protein
VAKICGKCGSSLASSVKAMAFFIALSDCCTAGVYVSTNGVPISFLTLGLSVRDCRTVSLSGITENRFQSGEVPSVGLIEKSG